MIVRIVRMKVSESDVSVFQRYFNNSFSDIRSFPGCNELALYTDVSEPGRLITVSRWDNIAALNAYRNSILFKKTWNKVKPLFISKPDAFSMTELI